jgi:predicted DNA repair protein MutK
MDDGVKLKDLSLDDLAAMEEAAAKKPAGNTELSEND